MPGIFGSRSTLSRVPLPASHQKRQARNACRCNGRCSKTGEAVESLPPSLHPTEASSQAQWFHVAGVCPRNMLPVKSNLPLQGQLCLGRTPACGSVSTIRHVSQPSHNFKNKRRLYSRCMPRHSTADSNKAGGDVPLLSHRRCDLK